MYTFNHDCHAAKDKIAFFLYRKQFCKYNYESSLLKNQNNKFMLYGVCFKLYVSCILMIFNKI